MKRVIFKQLTIRNFLSVGDDPVTITFNQGVCLVTGYNHDKDSRNGVGKSALFADALFFALFGTAMRNVGKSKLPNRSRNGRPVVELEFDVVTPTSRDHYLLTRAMKPSRLFLAKNGNDVSKTIAHSTNEIQSIISASPDVFRNCVIMALNQTLPFMAQRRPDKRRFIEGILGLDVFSDMLHDVRKQIVEKNRECDKLTAVLRERESAYDSLVNHRKRHITDISAQIKTLQQRIAANKHSLDQLSRRDTSTTTDPTKLREQLQKLKTSQQTVQAQIDSELEAQGEYKSTISNANASIKQANDILDVCPTCNRAFTHDQGDIDHKNAVLQQQADIVKQSTLALNDSRTLVTQKRGLLGQITAKITTIQAKISECETLTAQQTTTSEHLTSAISQQQDDIIALKNRLGEFDEDIAKSESLVHQAQGEVNDLQDALSILEGVRFVVSEEGVKAFIVKKMLQLFNSKLAHYLQKFEANCVCTFNEYFEETLVDDNGNDVEYASFSAGEQKRIDLAMLFAFQDVRRLQTDTTVNVGIYDELFDSSLDTKGVTNILELLKERATKFHECIYVVTHRGEAASTTQGISVLHLEKRDGITTVGHFEDNL